MRLLNFIKTNQDQLLEVFADFITLALFLWLFGYEVAFFVALIVLVMTMFEKF